MCTWIRAGKALGGDAVAAGRGWERPAVGEEPCDIAPLLLPVCAFDAGMVCARRSVRLWIAPPRFERATALTAQEMKGTLRREGLGAPGSCQTICTKMRKRKKLECAYNTSNHITLQSPHFMCGAP